MFSSRLSWSLEENCLAQKLRNTKSDGGTLFDLTESNPTQVGLPYPNKEILESLKQRNSLTYEADPLGLKEVRAHIASYHCKRGRDISPDHLVLTTSTSEAYSFLFKLLCDPGEGFLAPSPSYPLFHFLAALDAIKIDQYPLLFDDGWHLDFKELESAIKPSTRALAVVHPNNPTGSYLSLKEQTRLMDIMVDHRLSLIIDEVFYEYPLNRDRPPSFMNSTREGLTFVLGGLSKLAGLPQMKLSWIWVGGRPELRDKAITRLEHIADTYLTVSTPIQYAAHRLLELAPSIQHTILERVRSNYSWTREHLNGSPVTLLPSKGGWYGILKLPAIHTSTEWALTLLEQARIYTHPGDLFGLSSKGALVISLLTDGIKLQHGINKLVALVNTTCRT